jgi:D-alanyl-lipoteichoic acid acyltransferase DltB (MBOAT superfamily)
LPQFHKVNRINVTNFTDGFRLMLWGFFKKIAVADNLAIYVNYVYNNPEDQSGIAIMIATIFFAFQIYCDFSGYTDIAIGAARIMGYELMNNFRAPYFSKSIPEFWRRWHISLSSWFRDYVYIPLGGNRVLKWRWYYNLFITFLISGLWHGANWTFIIWGALHGFYMLVNVTTVNIRGSIINSGRLMERFFKNNALNVLFTFILVCIAWIFFRANSISDAGILLAKLTDINLDNNKIIVIDNASFYQILTVLFIMIFIHAFERNKRNINDTLKNWSLPLRWLVYSVLLWSIFLFGNFTEQEFIYFTF